MYIWMKVSKDKYELPLCIADTADELAKMCGTTANSIKSSISHGKKHNFKCGFVCVYLKENHDEEI